MSRSITKSLTVYTDMLPCWRGVADQVAVPGRGRHTLGRRNRRRSCAVARPNHERLIPDTLRRADPSLGSHCRRHSAMTAAPTSARASATRFGRSQTGRASLRHDHSGGSGRDTTGVCSMRWPRPWIVRIRATIRFGDRTTIPFPVGQRRWYSTIASTPTEAISSSPAQSRINRSVQSVGKTRTRESIRPRWMHRERHRDASLPPRSARRSRSGAHHRATRPGRQPRHGAATGSKPSSYRDRLLDDAGADGRWMAMPVDGTRLL